MSDLRILHVIPAIAPRYGGPTEAIFGMCRALGRRGIDVMIGTTDADGPGHLDITRGTAIVHRGVPTLVFRRQFSERFGYSRPIAAWLGRTAGRYHAVHVHAVFSHPSIAAARACRRRDVPYVVRPLGSLDPWSLRQNAAAKRVLWHVAVKRMLTSAAAVHYTTEQERHLAESALGLRNGVVIPIGVELADLTKEESSGLFRTRHPAVGRGPYVLTLSRLHPKKNIELLIDAFLSTIGGLGTVDWHLVVAGNGDADYVRALRQRAATHPDRVLFVGWLEGEERASALREAALLALPSHQENFGLAVAEAMAAGVPVLVSEQVNLAPEIRAHQAGWVSGLEATALSAALCDAFTSEAERRRRGAAGRALVEARFSWGRVAADLERLYDSIARAPRTPPTPNPENGL